MKPILYDKGGISSIGVLSNAISCSVSEQRNGEYTASLSYPYVGDYFAKIEYDSIVVMKPNQKSEPQMFRVSSISTPINGIVSYGLEHFSYELNKNPIFNASTFSDPESGTTEGTPEDIFNYIFLSAAIVPSYTGTSDISETKICELDFMSARDAIFKVQGYFGGELEWDNHKVILHRTRGVDNGTVISYGNNLIDYTKKIDVSNVFTAIAPYAQLDNEDGSKTLYTLPQNIVTYPNVDKYSYIRAKLVDFTGEFTDEELESIRDEHGIIDSESLIGLLDVKAHDYMYKNVDISNNSHNVTLSYVDLRKSKEFAAIDTMNDLGLCDYVTLKDERLGVSFKGQVISTKFNVLTEMYDSIEIGNPTQQLLDSLASIVNFDSGSKTIGKTVNDIEKNLDEYFSEIKVTDSSITFKSGSIKDIKGVYNTYKYKLERDTDIQQEGKKGRIISFTDPQNRKTKIVRA